MNEWPMNFFGKKKKYGTFDRGDLESWRCYLNCKSPAQEYRKLNLQDKIEKREMKTDERFRRLGIELRNNRRAHIRIAPMKGCDMPKSFLSQNINAVEKWIKNTVSQAKLNPIPANFSAYGNRKTSSSRSVRGFCGLSLILMKLCGMTK